MQPTPVDVPDTTDLRSLTAAVAHFNAGPTAYQLTDRAADLSDGHRNLLILWFAQHHPADFREVLAHLDTLAAVTR